MRRVLFLEYSVHKTARVLKIAEKYLNSRFVEDNVPKKRYLENQFETERWHNAVINENN